MKLIFVLAALVAGHLIQVVQGDEFTSVTGKKIGVKIMGTIVSKERNVVLLKEVNSGRVRAFREGSVLFKEYFIKRITKKFLLVIKKDKSRLRVYLDKFADDAKKVATSTTPANSDFFAEEGFERKGNEVKMTGMYRDKLVKEDLSKVLMQATALPYMKEGQIVGFEVSQIDSGSIYEKGGLRNNDIVTSINGIELNSVAGAIKLLQGLKQQKSIEVDVIRGGSPETIALSID